MLICISSFVLAGGMPDPSKPAPSTSNMAIVKNGTIVKVFYKKPDAGKVKVSIYKVDSGEAVFSEELKGRDGFVRPYNLRELPKGEYRVVMQDDSEKREEVINNSIPRAQASASIIKANENQFAVLLYSKLKNQVKVTLYDDDKNILLSQVYEVEGGASKLFNKKQLEGNVTVEVSDENGIIKTATVEE